MASLPPSHPSLLRYKPHLTDMPPSIFYTIADHVRHLVDSERYDSYTSCPCKARYVRDAGAFSDPWVALERTCRRFRSLLEGRKGRGMVLGYCKLGLRQTEADSEEKRENVRSLKIYVGDKHVLPNNAPSLRQLISHYPNVEHLHIHWSPDFRNPAKLDLTPAVEGALDKVASLVLDFQESAREGFGTEDMSPLLAHLGLGNLERMSLLLNPEFETFDNQDDWKVLRRACGKVKFPKLKVFDLGIEIPVQDEEESNVSSYKWLFSTLWAVASATKPHTISLRITYEFSIAAWIADLILQSDGSISEDFAPRAQVWQAMMQKLAEVDPALSVVKGTVGGYLWQHRELETRLLDFKPEAREVVVPDSNKPKQTIPLADYPSVPPPGTVKTQFRTTYNQYPKAVKSLHDFMHDEKERDPDVKEEFDDYRYDNYIEWDISYRGEEDDSEDEDDYW